MRWVCCFVASLALATAATCARAEAVDDCAAAGQAAEQNYQLPSGLLSAIGTVESGRWDALRARRVAWPWSIDVNGQGRQFDSRDEVLRSARAVLASGIRNVDVGCFQISLLHHPFAFADLEQAFTPAANADYAARFLVSLRARLGSWPAAIAAYHSADPERGASYRQLVFAAWHGASDVAETVTWQFPEGSVRIWTPSSVGSAQRVVVMPSASSQLPRIITPQG